MWPAKVRCAVPCSWRNVNRSRCRSIGSGPSSHICNRTNEAQTNNMFDWLFHRHRKYRTVFRRSYNILNERVVGRTEWTAWFSLFGTVDGARVFLVSRARVFGNFNVLTHWLLDVWSDQRNRRKNEIYQVIDFSCIEIGYVPGWMERVCDLDSEISPKAFKLRL